MAKKTHVMVAYSGEMTDVLRDVLRDHLSPEAVAAVAGLIGNASVAGAPGKEVKWFRRLLIETLGGQDAYWRLWSELTIQ